MKLTEILNVWKSNAILQAPLSDPQVSDTHLAGFRSHHEAFVYCTRESPRVGRLTTQEQRKNFICHYDD